MEEEVERLSVEREKGYTSNDNELYQAAQKEVDEAINELEKVGLSREQNNVVDKAFSATNASVTALA